MINIDFLKEHGTKENIMAYREHCIKNNCFGVLSFERFILQRKEHQATLNKFI